MQEHEFNTRILIIDDEENVRDSFKAILDPKRPDTTRLDTAATNLFGEKTSSQSASTLLPVSFTIETATNGQEGFERVQQAAQKNMPFAAIFVDMRMPGWDGLTTVNHIRTIDSDAEIIFVTAYSDHTIEDVIAKAGANVSYHCKPLASEEIQQLAVKAVYEWNKTRDLKSLLDVVSHLRAWDLQHEALLNEILNQTARMLGTPDALLISCEEGNEYKTVAAIGHMTHADIAENALRHLREHNSNDIELADSFAFFALNDNWIVAHFEEGAHKIKPERLYLVRIFLAQAVQALNNNLMQNKLLRHEKLSAVGTAVGMVAHDLRDSLSGIYSIANYSMEDDELPKETASEFFLIQQSAGNCMEYVADLLAFVRKTDITFDKEPISCESFLGTICEAATKLETAKDIRIELDIQDNFQFLGSRQKMHRVLLNLTKNALEVLRDHGTNQHPCVTLRSTINGDTGQITIQDNGPGIPEQVMNDLFTPFTTCNKTGGTGLGLAIVKQFVDAHHATIQVHTGSQGTQFVLSGFQMAPPA